MDPVWSESALRPSRRAPRITIILPTYNRERYLPEAIESILGQTFRDFELIIVDDGSTDSTPALVDAIDDDRVRYFAQPHSGLSAALNAAMRHARGEYIARLDSDDLFLPDAIATLVAGLEVRPEADLIWARARWTAHAGRAGPFPQRSTALTCLR
jgi:glycosyltransferase involved in cell wall biosynthesis